MSFLSTLFGSSLLITIDILYLNSREGLVVMALAMALNVMPLTLTLDCVTLITSLANSHSDHHSSLAEETKQFKSNF